MSTTPNQKDLLAKKSDLEGILKPDDNDVLHLPGVTITLAESGQFYLAGIDKKLLTLIGNTSGNAVTLDGDAGLTFTTSGGSSTITGITSLSGNSTSLAASQSMASAKQDKIVAGTNIQIAQDGKTISATDTNELENLTDVNITTPTDGQGLVYNNTTQKWENGNVSSASSIDTLTDVNLTNLTNGQILKYNSTSQEWENANESGGGGGSTVIPNPTGTPTDTLDTVSIDGTIYEIQGGGGGSGYTEETLYSVSSPTVAPNTLTLSNSYTDYDILAFDLLRSADSTWYHYETLIPTSNVSIGDDIQLTTYYGAWASYDITNATTLTLINSNSIYINSVKGLKFGEGGGSGGSSVTPNPQGTPTDTLSTIEIDGTIYDIEGSGGGGGGGQIDALWEGSAAPTTANPITVSLNGNISDYDMIMVNVYEGINNFKCTGIFAKLAVGDNGLLLANYDNKLYINIEVATDSSIIFKGYSSSWGAATTYTGIYGVKLGGGGGSSEVTYSTTEYKVGTWIDGRDVYEKVITATESTYHGDSMWNITLATGIDFLIEHNIMYRDPGLANNAWFPIVDTDDSNWANVMYGHHIRLENNNNLVAYFRGSLNRTGNVEIMGTIRYVKPVST